MPTHKATGKMTYHSILTDEHKYEPLMRHFEFLSNLGEDQATQVVPTLVDGVQVCRNCNNAHNVTYLPILMGYHSCYKQYMALLGYIVWSSATSALIIEGEDGKAVNPSEYIFVYPTYFYKWKHDFPILKVS